MNRLSHAVRLVVMSMIAGCASNNSGVVGVKTSSDANGFMLTSQPIDQVARCIAAVLGSAARPDGLGFAIASTTGPTLVYRVRPFKDELHRYATIVEVSGSTELPNERVPKACLSGATPRV